MCKAHKGKFPSLIGVCQRILRSLESVSFHLRQEAVVNKGPHLPSDSTWLAFSSMLTNAKLSANTKIRQKYRNEEGQLGAAIVIPLFYEPLVECLWIFYGIICSKENQMETGDGSG